ncbi:MAG: hypothetical protein LBD23_15445 [Oscillospiraceae bacterium]|nr:hypothetical protein [Oscillospiraceae bacterium]
MMKIIGWLLTLLGSNVLTATVVAKRFYNRLDETVNETITAASDWTLENLGEFIGDTIDGVIGDIPFIGSIGDSVAGLIDDNLSENISDFIKGFQGVSEQVDVSGRATADTLFYVALAVSIIGVAVLIISYIKGKKGKKI